MAGCISFDFTDARVWVTGASRGLGRDIAWAFARSGAHVAFSARPSAALDSTVLDARQLDPEAFALPLSVDSETDVRAAAEHLHATWGGVDVLINCAGVSPTVARTEELDVDSWRAILDVNLTGAFLCSRAVHPLMKAAGAGSIVNVSSIHGQRGMGRLSAYCASKGGMDSLTRSLALEWAGDGIRVNALAPGYVETDMTAGLRASGTWTERLMSRTPLRRFGTTEDVAPAALFLASDASAYTTGSVLMVDGGWTAA